MQFRTLRDVGSELGFEEGLNLSEYQSLLLNVKQGNATTRSWTNPKFMRFLYYTFITKDYEAPNAIAKPTKKTHAEVNFEDLQDQWGKIGKKAELFALKWEKERLIGADLSHLLDSIVDRRKQPGFGYDFLSHDAGDKPRFIEVKSVAKRKDGHRFFLSDNEYARSCSSELRKPYYFYLVSFDGKGNASAVSSVLASELYKKSYRVPCSYLLRFDMTQVPKMK